MWYGIYKESSYSNEIGFLNRYLKEGFDPYDYLYELKEYLEENGVEFPDDSEYYEVSPEWIEKASKDDLE
ncbi:MAG: hypothetical protein M0R32_05965, partial [Candidatus Cloacimonetes bacterium]|nr:hypothetical protein [Candidatus Cloacimonadota bacterium]